ncbi:hypothetical protein GCM10007162_13290 [Ignatzschineria ureiclastica]|nr:hypothetical protein GCM10007162_13290 [Ignatzschineria ureiclastica]
MRAVAIGENNNRDTNRVIVRIFINDDFSQNSLSYLEYLLQIIYSKRLCKQKNFTTLMQLALRYNKIATAKFYYI